MCSPSGDEHRPCQKPWEPRLGPALCPEMMPGIAVDSAVQVDLYLDSSVDDPCSLEH